MASSPPTPEKRGAGRVRPDASALAAEAMQRGQDLLFAGKPAEARRWLDRARRLAPDDAILDFLLATALLRLNDRAARPLLDRLAAVHDVREIWAALAAAAWQEGDVAAASAALATALRRHVLAPTALALAGRIAAAAGLPGWCGLGGSGRIHVTTTGRPTVWLDDRPIDLSEAAGGHALPPGWRNGMHLTVHGDGRPLLGSPIDLSAIRRVEGCVVAHENGVTGWAWHPADPDRDPRLILQGTDRRRAEFVATAPALVHHPAPLARLRLIQLSADAAAALGERIAVRVEGGPELPGSPVVPAASAAPARNPPRRVPSPSGLVLMLDGYAGPDPACFDDRLAALPRIHVRGPADWAAALRSFPGHDVLWLESPPATPGWLSRLQAAAYAAPGIGSVAALAARSPGPVNHAGTIEGTAPPPACVFLRHDCLAAGGLREDFATSGAAVAELCLRSAGAGWRHPVVPDVIVSAPEARPNPAVQALGQHDRDLLDRLHPAAETAADDLAVARRQWAMAQWRQRPADASAILISHEAGGGIERVIAARAAALRAQGLRPVVLRPAPGGCVVGEVGGSAFSDLRFRLPEELPALAALLGEARPHVIELHHLLGHRHAVVELVRLLDAPLDIFVHDYAAFCPRVALVGPEDRYCGEPDIAGCEACIAVAGSNLLEEISPAALRARSAADLAMARRVVVPSADTARRLRRHFPDIRPLVVPWEDDSALPPRRSVAPGSRSRVCVVGAIGVEKGYDVLLATARAAAGSHSGLEFVVVGHTIDDRALMAVGNVFVTGAYRDEELPDLIAAQQATVAFIPSIWPETWCFALSHAWRAGLDAVVFDIGAPAERVRQTGRGMILPLGLPPAAIANALVTAATLARDKVPSHHRAERHVGRAVPARTNRSKNA